MRLLEVEFDPFDVASQREAILKFIARDLIIKDNVRGWLHGMVLAEKDQDVYVFHHTPRMARDTERIELSYRNLAQLILINPQERDVPEVRADYQELA